MYKSIDTSYKDEWRASFKGVAYLAGNWWEDEWVRTLSPWFCLIISPAMDALANSTANSCEPHEAWYLIYRFMRIGELDEQSRASLTYHVLFSKISSPFNHIINKICSFIRVPSCRIRPPSDMALALIKVTHRHLLLQMKKNHRIRGTLSVAVNSFRLQR